MQSPAQKAIVIGMDGAAMELVQHMVDQGHMPHLGQLMAQGVKRPMIGVFPTLTPPGWTATSTGAWAGTHQVMDFNIRKLGGRLDETVWGINTQLSQAEYLWNTVERAGKKPILVKWEMSWPPTVQTGIQVEGTGPGVSNVHQITGYHLFVGGGWTPRPIGGPRDPETLDPSALQKVRNIDPVEIVPAEGWQDAPTSALPPKEVALVIEPLKRGRADMRRQGIEGTPKHFYGLIYASADQGYDRLLICRSRNGSDRVAELSVGQWTEWWKDSFELDGQALDGYVRMKLVSLSAAGDVFELFVPQVWPATGYTQPEEVAQQIDENVGNFLQNPARDALGVVDDATYFELLDFHHQRLAEVAAYLTESNDWDVLFIETHASDYTSHFFLSQADECSGADAHTLARCQAGVAQTYASIDDMIGRVVELADDDTVVAVVADHGGTPNQHRPVDIAEVLEQAGFLVYADAEKKQINWQQTRAANVGLVHIFVNLKGREPTGIVDPSDYEQTRLDLIEALHAYRHPQTGRAPFALALTREDAEMVNLEGELVGDVVYALRPEYDGAHGKQLPSATLGIGGQHCTFVLAGAGVKQGLALKRQVRAVDVAPTLCYLLGIPMPEQVEGGVIYEALEDADWHLR